MTSPLEPIPAAVAIADEFIGKDLNVIYLSTTCAAIIFLAKFVLISSLDFMECFLRKSFITEHIIVKIERR